MMNPTKPLLALALAGLALNAYAHKPWLKPTSTLVESREPWVSFDAAISEDLFEIDHRPLDFAAFVATGPDGAKIALQNAVTGKLRSTFDIPLAKPGTYKVAMVSQRVSGSYKLNGETKRLMTSEETLAKDVPAGAEDVRLTRTVSRLETFVSTGKPDEAVLKPTGAGLELVPVTHPNDIRVGEKVTWRFLVDGKPAANQPFSLIPGGVKYRGVLNEVRHTTDAKGEITFTVANAGMYLVSSSWPTIARVEGQPPQQVPRRLSYAATVEVLPE